MLVKSGLMLLKADSESTDEGPEQSIICQASHANSSPVMNNMSKHAKVIHDRSPSN